MPTSRLAANKQQTIAVSAPPNFITMCDPDRMREAIDNLVSNAIKYSPIGGKIAVRSTTSRTTTVIRVADEGAGLSPEDLGRLFGRFQRLSAKPTAGESSTGLGLSIVKRIIDMHGGQVTAESGGPGTGIDLHRQSCPRRICRDMTQKSAHHHCRRRGAGPRDGRRLSQDARLYRDAVRRRQEPARAIETAGARSRRARPEHAGGGRAFDHPRPEEPHQRAGHHADGDREPDRPRGRARTRRRRLHRKALRIARIDGAHPLGAAAERSGQDAGGSARGRRGESRQGPIGAVRHQMARSRRRRRCATTRATNIR